MRQSVRFILAVLAAMAAGRAQAQSLEPMRGEVTSFTDRFAVQVYPGNPYNRPVKIDLRVYDEFYRPIEATVYPASILIGAQLKRRVLVVVPFGDATSRHVKICAEALSSTNMNARIRTQVCGTFIAKRLG